MNEVYEFIKSCGTYFLATVEDDQPRVRPFGTVNIFDGKLPERNFVRAQVGIVNFVRTVMKQIRKILLQLGKNVSRRENVQQFVSFEIERAQLVKSACMVKMGMGKQNP